MASVLRFLICAAFSIALFGCGLARQAEMERSVEDAKKVMQAEIAECERLYPSKTQRPVTPRIRCMKDARTKLAEVALGLGDKNYDQHMLVLAKLLVIAEQYDAGKLTEAQFELQKAQAIAEYNSVLAQRQNDNMIATAAMVASMPKTCTGYGNTVTCF
ncbi:MAG: hypothetical protein ACLPWS_04030 [Rhodomicrobium sp.]